ncbi:hypothetical protein ACJJTC_003704 [Scirpophaga incertulas]
MTACVVPTDTTSLKYFRLQLASFTIQRDNTKRSQRLRCYRGRHEYSKTRGSRVNGRPSIATRREWDDRHFMNREPSLIDLGRHRARPMRTRSTIAAGSTAQARTARGCSGPGGSDVRTEHGGARAGSAQLTYRDFAS